MEILRTSLTKQNLQDLDTLKRIEQTPNSVFFNVFDIPNFDLGAGNHSFLLYGSEYLIRGSEIVIEMLDEDGQVIKTKAQPDTTNSPAWRVTFQINPNHKNGLAILNIAGTAYFSENDKWEQRNRTETEKNVLWTKHNSI